MLYFQLSMEQIEKVYKKCKFNSKFTNIYENRNLFLVYSHVDVIMFFFWRRLVSFVCQEDYLTLIFSGQIVKMLIEITDF